MIWQEGAFHPFIADLEPQVPITLEGNWYLSHGVPHRVKLETFSLSRAEEIARLYTVNRTHFEQYDSEWVDNCHTPEQISRIIRNRANHSKYSFSILDEANALVGTCAFELSTHRVFATLEYYVALNHTGNGYAGKSVAMLIDFVYTQKKIHQFIATVHDDNLPSQKTVEKLGFVYHQHEEYRPNFRIYELHK